MRPAVIGSFVVIIGDALDFAERAHGSQLYGRKPYHVHLLDVVMVARRFFDWNELTQSFVDACLLHDTLEDTTTSYADLASNFGELTADLVLAVTNPAESDKHVRSLMLYKKIREMPGAINVKLCDRIANIEQCTSFERIGRRPDKMFKRYLDKWPEFESILRGRCAGEGATAQTMWAHLERLFVLGRAKMEEDA